MKASLWGGLFLLVLSVTLISCKGNQGKNGKQAGEGEQVDDGFTYGVIVTSRAAQGCPVLVRVELDGKTKLHRPISLPEAFAEDGKKIKFKYRPSRAMQKACEDGMPLIVSEVSERK